MMRPRTILPILLAFFLVQSAAQAQTVSPETQGEGHRHQAPVSGGGCITPAESRTLLQLLGPNWGYGFNDLTNDLARWNMSPYVETTSIGSSVQGRPIWELTITSDENTAVPRRRVYIHARTHPGEIQSFRVTEQVINYLLSENNYAKLLRERAIFHIVPMYNPDGVELERPRENANNVDLERGWDKEPMEPEVAALKARFTELMTSTTPIEIALNMHSALACKRYFVYHDAAGTSEEFATLQQRFITDVRSYFPDGIQPWPYLIAWKGGAPTHFPESWYWFNHRENVMALTYEDMNCESAGMYDSTAYAILHGIGEYLGFNTPSGVFAESRTARGMSLENNVPNPFSSSTSIRYSIPVPLKVLLEVYDINGERVALLVDELQDAGSYRALWNARGLPSGVYLCRLQAGDQVISRHMTLTHR